MKREELSNKTGTPAAITVAQRRRWITRVVMGMQRWRDTLVVVVVVVESRRMTAMMIRHLFTDHYDHGVSGHRKKTLSLASCGWE